MKACKDLGQALLKLSLPGLDHGVGHPSSRCPKSKHRTDFRPAFWVAERSRRGDRICRSWHLKNHINLSVIVMRVTDTGDKVAYRLGRSKGRSRTQTSRGGPIRGRRHDRCRHKCQSPTPGRGVVYRACYARHYPEKLLYIQRVAHRY